ncbi:MAG: TetR/AcrR family transcriptional regulator [Chloroflexi bacterium]|nr:TetR/AcrR family transcriptional regulator [Chloroflexota bacterium]
MVARDGFSAATVREIARTAGCTTGTLSHYFRGRNEMIAFAFDLVVADVCDQVDQRAATTPPGRARLEMLVEEFQPDPTDSDPTAVVTLWAWAQAATDKRLAGRLRHNYDRLRQLATRFVEEAITAGDLPHDANPSDTADTIICFADGLCAASILDPRRFPPDRRVELTERLLTRLRA